MRLSFLLANFILILYVLTSCVSSKVVSGDVSLEVAPIIRAEESSQKYNLQFDFMKHHFSGLLIVRKLPDNEIRIVASTYFGLSLFDFSLRGNEFHVNSCIEPMRKKKILRLLETDFKNLFLSENNLRIRKKSNTFEKRTTGSGFGKSVFYLSEFVAGQPEQIRIKHPWLRFSMQLKPLP